MDTPHRPDHATHPWVAYAREEQQQHILETFRSRREAIAWVDAQQYTYPKHGLYIHDSVIIQRTDIDPILYTPYDVIIVHGHEVLHTTDTSTNNIHRNTAALDTIIQPIIHSMKLRMYPYDRTGALTIRWHHPLPHVFPFTLEFLSVYTQTMDPSTITISPCRCTEVTIDWGHTPPRQGYPSIHSYFIDDDQDLLAILHRILQDNDQISQHGRMQCTRQLPHIINPDIHTLIRAEHVLD